MPDKRAGRLDSRTWFPDEARTDSRSAAISKPVDVSTWAEANIVLFAPGDEPLGLMIESASIDALRHEQYAFAVEFSQTLQILEHFFGIRDAIDNEFQLIGVLHQLSHDLQLLPASMMRLVP